MTHNVEHKEMTDLIYSKMEIAFFFCHTNYKLIYNFYMYLAPTSIIANIYTKNKIRFTKQQRITLNYIPILDVDNTIIPEFITNESYPYSSQNFF